jgi:hypothetical protein
MLGNEPMQKEARFWKISSALLGVLKEGNGILRHGSDEIREGIHLKVRLITASKG